MKKRTFLMLALLLVGCTTNGPTSNESSIPNNNSMTSESNSDNSTPSIGEEYQPFSYENRVSEYNIADISNSLGNSYSDYTLKVEETSYYENSNKKDNNFVLIKFDNVSSQATFPGFPILNAYNKNNSSIRYVTILSPSMFDIEDIDVSLSLWSQGDANNVPSNYYLGLEYLKDNEWHPLKSIDINDVEIGKNENVAPFSFKINEKNIRNIRLTFDFKEAAGNVRFALYSLSIKGKQRVVTNNSNITQISFPEKEMSIKEGEKLLLNPTITSKDENKFVEYLSSDRYIATVDEEGIVTALSVGEALITAKNGNISDNVKITVVDKDKDYTKLIQTVVNFVGEIPEGFKSNFNTYFGGAQLNFKEEGNYVLTPNYNNITRSTIVVLNMMLSSAADIDLSKENIFTVEGLNSDGEVVEKVQKTNLVNTTFEDVEFEFNSTNIVQYRVVFEHKHSVDYGTYFKTGKNYCLNSLMIYQK
ncbi:MAG: Ig-like domain-containing protein [Erysipelotrichales bacterium]|nr:Ig-like domain-containing protein [Erysipelotrichales bacterium]